MSEREIDARTLTEQLKQLPEEVVERVGYIIQGAALVAGNGAKDGTEGDER